MCNFEYAEVSLGLCPSRHAVLCLLQGASDAEDRIEPRTGLPRARHGVLDGLLVVGDHSAPCVKHEGSAPAGRARVSARRICEPGAIAAAGPTPADHDRFQIRLAS